MCQQEVEADVELNHYVLEFFRLFSRIEFALKEVGYFKKPDRANNTANPDWDRFVKEFPQNYTPSPSAILLMQMRPKRQVVQKTVVGAGTRYNLVFEDIDFNQGHENINNYRPDKRELYKIVTLVKTVRNNLFHGGKYGHPEWDDKQRTKELLRLGIIVLKEIASQHSIEASINF
jgi:hypothetical protein